MNTKKKLILMSVLFIVILAVMFYNGASFQILMLMSIVFIGCVMLIIAVVSYKERNTPYHNDERALLNAYKADSITLRVMLISLVLASFILMAFDISTELPLKYLLLYLFYAALLLKFIIFKLLNRSS